MILATVFWTLVGFISGALPFSVWIGRYWLHKDIREFGDKNPGATNVLRAGGVKPFVVALLLDICKGILPVGIAYHIFGLQGWEIVPVAFAPPLGHTFSPFLGWQGGKSVAAAFGVWIGLTFWQMPIIAVTTLVILAWLVKPPGWAIMGTLAVMAVALAVWFQNPILTGVWATQVIILGWSHRHDLRQRPIFRSLNA